MKNNGDLVPITLGDPSDAVLEALGALVDMIGQSSERNLEIIRRIRYVMEQRAQGRSYADIAESQPHPLIIELATDNLEELMEAACRLRRAQAAALHDEGVTMDRIAELFGVTRQRISQILRQREGIRDVA